MKGLYLGCLLLAIGRSLAQSAEMEMEMEPMTPECQAEMDKYNPCLLSGESAMSMMNSKESIQKYCASKEVDACKAYRDDILKTEMACTTSGNLTDMMSAFMVLAARFTYLTYCTKGEDGNYCPLSNYLQENAGNMSTPQEGQLTSEQLQAISDDCKDSKCNARMMTILTIGEGFTSMMGNGGYSKRQFSFASPATPFIEFYKDKNCAAIVNSAPSSGGTPNGSTSGGTPNGSTSGGAPSGSTSGGDSSSGAAPSGSSAPADSASPSASSSSTPSATATEAPGSNDSAAFTLKKITYSFITMVLLSSALLLF